MIENNATIDPATRLKRLRMRAWRRGMKEMDLIIGGFVDREGAALSDDDMSALEILMNRQDQHLFLWASGAAPAPADATEEETRIMARITNNFQKINGVQPH